MRGLGPGTGGSSGISPDTAEDLLAGEFLPALTEHLQTFYPPSHTPLHPTTGEMKTAGDICSVLLKCEGPTAFKLVSEAVRTESEQRGTDLGHLLLF